MEERQNFFLAPRSNETSFRNFRSTIEGGVSYDEIKDVVDSRGKEILSKQQKIFAWGCADSLKSRWDKMRENDIVLFYVKGVFRYAGKVIHRQFSDKLSDKLWPRKNDKPWSCVFFLSDMRDIHTDPCH